MGSTITAALKVVARINVSANDPREASIEASSNNVLEWEILDEPDRYFEYEVVEVLESEPNGPDYEPDIMFIDVPN